MRHNPVSLYATFEDAGFANWLGSATLGQMAEYHRGFLARDVDPRLSVLRETERLELVRAARRAYWAYEHRLVHLVQRRLASGQFSYLAIRRPGARAPADFSLVLLECAA